MTDKKKSSGSLPIPVLNQIMEHAVGGFIIFYFNSKTGLPEHVLTFDTPAHSLALQKYISDWSTALHEINIDSAANGIRDTLRNDDENEDE